MMKTRGGSRKQRRQKFLLFVFLFLRLYQLKIQFRILASQQQIASPSRAEAVILLLVAFCDRRRRRGGVGGGDEKDDEKDDENARRRAKAARDFPSSHRRFDMLPSSENDDAREDGRRNAALYSRTTQKGKQRKRTRLKFVRVFCVQLLRRRSSSSPAKARAFTRVCSCDAFDGESFPREGAASRQTIRARERRTPTQKLSV